MKRPVPFLALILALLASCAPPAVVENNVVPTIVSVQMPAARGGEVVLVGRYFGDGRGGEREDSYLLVGTRSDCTGGYRMQADAWTANRITFREPAGVGAGFVCVVSAGTTSNAMPFDAF